MDDFTLDCFTTIHITNKNSLALIELLSLKSSSILKTDLTKNNQKLIKHHSRPAELWNKDNKILGINESKSINFV